MLKATIFFSVFTVCAVGLIAQDDAAQYPTWMKAAGGATRAARQAITAKDNAAVTAQAKIMEDNFDQIAQFWTKRNQQDAVQFATTARDAAKTLGAATTPEDQTTALQKINGTCNGCHMAHREGPNGIK